MGVQLKFLRRSDRTVHRQLGAYEQDQYRIVGTRGHLELRDGYEYAGPRELRVSVRRQGTRAEVQGSESVRAWLVAFSRAILEDTEVEPDGERGLRDVRVIVAALKSARENRGADAIPGRRGTGARRPADRIYDRRCASRPWWR